MVRTEQRKIVYECSADTWVVECVAMTDGCVSSEIGAGMRSRSVEVGRRVDCKTGVDVISGRIKKTASKCQKDAQSGTQRLPTVEEQHLFTYHEIEPFCHHRVSPLEKTHFCRHDMTTADFSQCTRALAVRD